MNDAALAIPAKAAIDPTIVGAAIAVDLATRFGIAVDAKPFDVSESRDGVSFSLAVEQTFGVFKTIITEAVIRVRSEQTSDGTLWTPVSLRYQHVGGGSNGHDVITYWLRDGAIENHRING